MKATTTLATLFLALCTTALPAQTKPLRVFISVDMEGIGGIGTAAMTHTGGKDYETGRALMTAEVNAVVAAIFEHGAAEILVNDSHGDMQNLLHTQLDPRVQYLQGNIKPYGMAQGLDSTFDAVIFVGFHAKAGTPDAFIAHTGSGAVVGLWLNGSEVGEGGLNAIYAGSLGVPVIAASGDVTFTREITALIPGIHAVATKEAVGAESAKLIHPDVVRTRLRDNVGAALGDLARAKPVVMAAPITVRLRFDTITRADVVMAIPGVRRVDGTAIEFQARSMREAYPLIRLMYKYLNL
jgi:D-amino peptidase